MKRTTRFICIIAIFTLITGIFTSCTNSGNGTNPSESTTTSFVETSETTTTAVTTAEYPMYDDAGNLVFKQCTNEEFNLPKYARYLTTATAFLSAYGIETTPQELFECFPKAPFNLETEEFPNFREYYLGDSIEKENFGCHMDVIVIGLNNFFTDNNLPYEAKFSELYGVEDFDTCNFPVLVYYADFSHESLMDNIIFLKTATCDLAFSTDFNPAVLLKTDSKNLTIYESVLGNKIVSKKVYSEFINSGMYYSMITIEQTN